MSYNPWPLGKLKKKHRRTEPYKLLKKGYYWEDPRDIVDIFERKVAKFWGADYAVAVDCCSHAIFLSLQYLKSLGITGEITVPKNTYVSVPMQVLHAGFRVKFKEIQWEGAYRLTPTNVVDAAVMWTKGGYIAGTLMCLSFQIKKAIPVGKMGVILTDNKKAYEWLKLASYDGRNLETPYDSKNHVKILGWHMYATPEDCARAILLMDDIKEKGSYMSWKNYPDITNMVEL